MKRFGLFGIKKDTRLAVFISGGGSTLQSLLEESHQLRISLVITNKAKCAGVLKAKRFGIPVHVLTDSNYAELNEVLLNQKISAIILAGFMKIIPPEFVRLWQGRMLNIHPSLLPDFKGLEAVERAWSANHDVGASLHYVSEGVDEGQLIAQKISSKAKFNYNLDETMLLLRRTEQHLLRQVCYL